MVRNENVAGFADQPVPADTKPDTDIAIEGGIWTTLATSGVRGQQATCVARRPNRIPSSAPTASSSCTTSAASPCETLPCDRASPSPSILANVARLRRGRSHARRASARWRPRQWPRQPRRHPQRPSGDSQDDPVALNAWEWKNYAPSYGPIHRCTGRGRDRRSRRCPGCQRDPSAPGREALHDGTTLDCPLENITLRRITDIREFKLYDQPNLELGRDKDFSIGVGTLKNIRFEDLIFNRPGIIELHANTDGLDDSERETELPAHAGLSSPRHRPEVTDLQTRPLRRSRALDRDLLPRPRLHRAQPERLRRPHCAIRRPICPSSKS